jgi:hypothetical protein
MVATHVFTRVLGVLVDEYSSTSSTVGVHNTRRVIVAAGLVMSRLIS